MDKGTNTKVVIPPTKNKKCAKYDNSRCIAVLPDFFHWKPPFQGSNAPKNRPYYTVIRLKYAVRIQYAKNAHHALRATSFYKFYYALNFTFFKLTWFLSVLVIYLPYIYIFFFRILLFITCHSYGGSWDYSPAVVDRCNAAQFIYEKIPRITPNQFYAICPMSVIPNGIFQPANPNLKPPIWRKSATSGNTDLSYLIVLFHTLTMEVCQSVLVYGIQRWRKCDMVRAYLILLRQ